MFPSVWKCLSNWKHTKTVKKTLKNPNVHQQRNCFNSYGISIKSTYFLEDKIILHMFICKEFKDKP